MLYGIEQTVYYTAWDTQAQDYVADTPANQSLFWNADGVAAAPTNAPVAVDPSGQPGLFKIVLTAAETSCLSGRLFGTTTTANTILIFQDIGPVRLPDKPFNDADGLPLTSHLDARTLPSASYALENTSQVVLSTGGDGPWTTANTDDLALEDTSQQILTTGGEGPWTTGGGGTALTPEEIWTYANRSLTDKDGFSLVNTGLDAISEWGVTIAQVNLCVANSDMWTDDEKKQIRFQIGIDGLALQPTAAIPGLSTYNPSTDMTRANVVQVNGNTDILLAWARNLATIVATQVTDNQASPTPTEFFTDLVEPDTDHFKNRAVIVYDGAIAKQASLITGYELSNGEGKITVAGFTRAPAVGDTLIIV